MLHRSVLGVLVFAVWAAALGTGYVLHQRETDAVGVLADAESSSPAPAPAPTRAPVITPAPPIAMTPPSAPASVAPGPMAAAPVPEPVPASPPVPVSPALPAPPARIVPGRVAGTPCMATVSACVKLSSRRAWLILDGKVVVGPVSITSGKKGERTPVGMHSVLWKDADHKSKEFDDAPMPWSVFFADGGIAFHTGSLRAQSSGCVHLSNAIAKKFFNFLKVGDPIQVVR